MMNPYSFNPYSQRNSSMMSNQSFGVKPPATFGEWLKRFFLRMWGYIIRGYSISKNILWCASIVLPLILADTLENTQEMENMMQAYGPN